MSGHADHSSTEIDLDHEQHAEEPAPAEPETPMWLQFLGVGFLLLAVLVYVVTRSGEPAPGQPEQNNAPARAALGAPGH